MCIITCTITQHTPIIIAYTTTKQHTSLLVRTAQFMTFTTVSEYDRTKPESEGFRPESRPVTEKKEAHSITTIPCAECEYNR